MVDRAKQAVMLETDRPHVLREIMYVCRPAGTISVPGVYGGVLDKVPFGMAMNKGLTLRMNQTPVKRYQPRLFEHIQAGHIKPSDVITHRVPLEDIADGYHMMASKLDGCIKPVLVPPTAKA